MARRKLEEEHVNHERWLVSYADFITLLFAFFVVMYSISQVNDAKYRVLSNTLTSAFNQPEYRIDPLQVGEVAKSNPTDLIQLDAMAIKERDGEGDHDAEREPGEELPDEFRRISDQVEQQLRQLMQRDLVSIRGNEEWLEISLSSSLLFQSGEAILSNQALPVLGQIAAILNSSPNPVRVEGFTDNVPIRTSRYPSNWELSAARAVSVVQFFIEEGIDPDRLVALGYGEFQAVGDNATPEGRARNRRVVLMISKTGRLRPQLQPLEPKRGAARGGEGMPPATLPEAAPQPDGAPPAALAD